MTRSRTIPRFLKAGSLGSIRIGVSQDHVLELLGQPPRVSAIESTIWKYDDLQIGLDDGEVVLLGLYPQGSAALLPRPFGRVPIGQLATLSAARIWLSEQRIGARRVTVTSHEDQVALQTEGGVMVYFVETELDSIQIARWTKPPPWAATVH